MTRDKLQEALDISNQIQGIKAALEIWTKAVSFERAATIINENGGMCGRIPIPLGIFNALKRNNIKNLERELADLEIKFEDL